MKKNGFVSMTLVYTFLIVFLFLILAILNAYSKQSKYKNAIDDSIDLKIKTKYDYCEYASTQAFSFSYNGKVQSFTSKCNGKYKIELWGANGGGNNGGKGAYTSGIISLKKNNMLYVFVGGKGAKDSSCNSVTFNANSEKVCTSGGGATDVRLIKGINETEWNYYKSLSSRIMVAAGGGGANFATGNAGNAGGIEGVDGTTSSAIALGGAKISTQTNKSTYFGETNILLNGNANSSGGGGGYFAGETSTSTNGGGGSSYISGHPGCIAVIREGSNLPREVASETCTEDSNEVECSVHYSNYQFTNTLILDGSNVDSSYQNPDGTGNGYAKITFVKEE